jgi:hypothetical protein
MAKKSKANGTGGKGGKKKAAKPGPTSDGFHAHLIRLPDREARLRAIMLLGRVPGHYCGFPDYRFLVGNEHIEVLQRANIPFELLS